MRLLDEKTGSEVKVGDMVETFIGESVKVLGFSIGCTPQSSGRVLVQDDNGVGEYYPGVIGCTIER